MIDFDYEIERDEADEIIRYFPDKIASPLESSTAYIEGPNSSGKSTLLHLIALGFHGLENEDLARPLREKLEDLIKNDKIVFDIRINDDQGNTILQAKKEDKENDVITTYHDEGNGLESIDSSTFRKNYKLIYDIPDNPTERIEQIADDVKYYQTSVANNLSNFSSYVREVLTDITEGRDPKRITRLQSQIKGLKSNLTMLKNQMIRDGKEFDGLCQYVYPHLLAQHTHKVSSIDSELSRLKSSVASKTTAKKTSKTKYANAIKIINAIIENTQREYRKSDVCLKALFSGTKYEALYIDKWLKADFIEIRTDYSIPEGFVEIVNEFRDLCDDVYQMNQTAEQTSQIYSQIVDTLREALRKEVVIPDIGRSVNDFIDEIEKLKEVTRAQAYKAKNARVAIESLDLLVTFLNNLKREHFPNLLKLSDKVSGTTKDKTNDVEILRLEQALLLRRRKIKAKVEEYKYKCAKYGVSEFGHTKMLRENKNQIAKFVNHTDDQLAEELEYCENEAKKSRKQFEISEIRISRDGEELERLENKKPHKYEDDKDVIETVMNYLGSLERKFINTFSRTLDSYKSKKKLPKKSNFPKEYETAKSYYDGVSSYLGSKLGTIRHIDGEYVVTKVDLVSGNITTDGGKKIRLRSMGTGQTQSTYLQSKLKSDYGGRKLIVMFDEVGMMDDNSMEPIKNMINTLKNEGSLLVGLVVQRLDSGVKITPI